MPYEYSPAQRRYLSRKHATDREMDRCCDCMGCDFPKCKGFIRGCPCENDMAAIRDAQR